MCACREGACEPEKHIGTQEAQEGPCVHEDATRRAPKPRGPAPVSMNRHSVFRAYGAALLAYSRSPGEAPSKRNIAAETVRSHRARRQISIGMHPARLSS